MAMFNDSPIVIAADKTIPKEDVRAGMAIRMLAPVPSAEVYFVMHYDGFTLAVGLSDGEVYPMSDYVLDCTGTVRIWIKPGSQP